MSPGRVRRGGITVNDILRDSNACVTVKLGQDFTPEASGAWEWVR